MSKQIEFLKNTIRMAKSGHEGTLKLLRQICVAAAEGAPPGDLIKIGECLVDIGEEASRTAAEKN